jgi:hypothetical protein
LRRSSSFEVFGFKKIIIKFKEVAVRNKIRIFALWTTILAAVSAGRAESFFKDRAGITLRGAYWAMRNENPVVRVSTRHFGNSHVDVGGAGGWITFISGVGGRGGIEFSLGGVGHAQVDKEDLFTDQVDVSGAMPILLGFLYPLFSERNFSAFQPYVSAGGGPYILSRVQVTDSGWDDDEVTVKNRVRPGIYGAAGGYFLLAKWFALQGEMRYHLVNFDPDDGFSGFELGVGLAFFWKR